MSILEIPEIVALDSRRNIIRLPGETDAPLTPRVRRIIDTPQFRRLAGIRQLGLVSLVYPGAIHSRFEHSLGVYRLALILLQRLTRSSAFESIVSWQGAELLILSALLHDVGHYPFCHPIEDMRLPGEKPHEAGAARYLLDESSEIATAIREDWNSSAEDVLYLLSGALPRGETFLSTRPNVRKLLAGLLSGPADIDKMDYLFRDSLHAGVPYGKNFDQERLLSGFCLNQNQDGPAISTKGKTAAELMVFARYVMFSEVYWHHTVRSATAMLQRMCFEIYQHQNRSGHAPASLVESLQNTTDAEAIRYFETLSTHAGVEEIWSGLFGQKRCLYKQIAEFSYFEAQEPYHRLARRPFAELAQLARQTAFRLQESGVQIEPHEILIDAPPVEKEIEWIIDVRDPKDGKYRPLAEISPAVRVLATEQFDDFVKRARLFVHPRQIQNASRILEAMELR
ncbi:MAG: HD domain-containing protein [Planctomycetia bacterium]|nr:HD domain-containing protein [Planctomycetia bacterium]